MKAMMGKIFPDWTSEILGTGFVRFEARCGVMGLAREDGESLHVLAIESTTPGKGQFRKFVELSKKNYSNVYIWEVWNEWLRPVLRKYGFNEVSEFHHGDYVDGFVWRKNET